MIGGDSRPEHAERLRTSFELAAVLWPVTNEHNASAARLEPLIARPEVTVVLLLIRWIRHSLNDVAAMCERHDKPLVRVPGRYDVETVAPLILAPCGRRLGGGP